MEFSLLLLLFILNFCLVIELLTFSQIILYLIYIANQRTIKLAFINLTTVIEASNSPSTTIVVTDTSIKNNVVTLVLHIHTYNNPIAKTIHYVVHITSTEAKLFAIRMWPEKSLTYPCISFKFIQ